MEQKNGKGWDKNFIVAMLGFIAAVLALVVAVTTPELRHFFGLKEDNPPVLSQKPAAPAQFVPVPQPKPEQARPSIATPSSKSGPKIEPQQHVEKAKPPSGPFSATLHENQPQLIDAAKTRLTAAFYNNTGTITAKLTIAPDVTGQITLPTVGSGSKEFASSAGIFLVHILNVDWSSRIITVQVSRKL